MTSRWNSSLRTRMSLSCKSPSDPHPISCSHPCRYRIGEAFIHMPHPRAVKRLEKDLAALNAELEKCISSAEECEKQMKELKVILYAKFGRAINLDE